MLLEGIVQGERERGATKKPVPVCREEEACGAHDLISPGRTGWELAPASPLRETGCCGFTGPYPSATLDKISTKLSSHNCKRGVCGGQCFSWRISQIMSAPGVDYLHLPQAI